MGADGHIAIYDWELVQKYLRERTDKYRPVRRWQERQFRDPAEARAFCAERNALRAGSATVYNVLETKGGCTTYTTQPLPGANRWDVRYYDYDDVEPEQWPGYVCDWTCNGRPACLVYWGDNLMSDPFDGLEWLEEWANANALLAEQEVWT